MSDAKAKRDLLVELGKEVRSRGWFPPTGDVRDRKNHALIDEMLNEHLLWRSDGFYAWSLKALRLAKDDEFLSEELRRAADFLDAMTGRLDAKKREPVSVPEMAKGLRWKEPNEARRAAYVLMHEPSGGNAILLCQTVHGQQGVPEMIQPGEGLWRLDRDWVMNEPPPPPRDPVLRPSFEGEQEEEDAATILSAPMDRKTVFVVYGRNAAAAEAMRAFLRSLTLVPSDFDEVKRRMGGSPFIGQVIRRGVEEAAAVIVIFTPDERATLRAGFQRDDDAAVDKERWQARPNVIFEAGLAMGVDENKTILVTLGSDVSLFSDASGRHILRMDNSAEKRDDLRALLEAAGCDVQLQRDWTRSGEFEACVPAADVARDGPAAPLAAPAQITAPVVVGGKPRLVVNVRRLLAGPHVTGRW